MPRGITAWGVTVAGAAAVLALALAAPADAAVVRVEREALTEIGGPPTLVVRAEPGEANDIAIATNEDAAFVRDTGAALQPGAGCSPVSPNEVRCGRVQSVVVTVRDGDDGVRSLGAPAHVFGGDGADTLQYEGSSATLEGGDGDDRLTGPTEGSSSLGGGPGDDVLTGGARPDALDGEGGRDVLRGGDEQGSFEGDFLMDGDGLIQENGEVAPVDADVLDGGGGGSGDTASYHWRDAPLDLDLNRSAGQGQAGEDDTFASIESANGGRGADSIVAGPASARLSGNGGNDVITGGPAGDIVDGGGGDDTASGGPGPDGLSGQTGNDTLSGDGGGDGVFGDQGDDRLGGGEGEDEVIGDVGRDAFDAGPGDDVVDAFDPVVDPPAESPVCRDGTDVVVVDRRDTLAAECERIAGGARRTPWVLTDLRFAPPRRVLMPLDCDVRSGLRCVLAVELRAGGRVVGRGSVTARRGQETRVSIRLDGAFAERLRRRGAAEVRVVARNRVLRGRKLIDREVVQWITVLRSGG